jgi:hypothetical protein
MPKWFGIKQHGERRTNLLPQFGSPSKGRRNKSKKLYTTRSSSLVF